LWDTINVKKLDTWYGIKGIDQSGFHAILPMYHNKIKLMIYSKKYTLPLTLLSLLFLFDNVKAIDNSIEVFKQGGTSPPVTT